MPLGIFGKLSGPSALGRKRGLAVAYAAINQPTGATTYQETVDGITYQYYKITNAGTYSLDVTAGGSVDFIIVGGGSYGARTTYGTYARNGGSGGGVIEQLAYDISSGTYNIVVGNNGTSGYTNKDGEDTTFAGFTAGGAIGPSDASQGSSSDPVSSRGYSGSPQSYSGGNGRQWSSSSYNYGGGGAGAGGNGGSYTDNRGGNGGPGYLSSITGERYGAGAKGALDQSSNSDPANGDGWGNPGSGGQWNSNGYDGMFLIRYEIV